MFIVLLCGCEKSDDSPDSITIRISNVEGSYTGTSQVYAINWLEEAISFCKAESVMNITLPGKVAAKFITPIGDDFHPEYYDVSDPEAEWTDFVYFVGTASGNTTGEFVRIAGSTGMMRVARYCYASSPVTVEGENMILDNNGNEVEIKVNLSLVRGWNLISQKIYYTELEDEEYVYYKYEYANGFAGGNWFFFEETE